MKAEELYPYFQKSNGVTTDTRSCHEGALFFALRGEHFNGNAYAAAALEAGCSYAVVDDAAYYNASNPRLLWVEDTLKALQALARHHRQQLGIPVIGITGTNGKTTTKELTSAVLSRKYHTHYTQGNLNNAIGVPLTLLQMKPEHEIAVIEMGASHPGDIRELVEIAEPDCGLITNVGRAHLQGFGSFEGVVQTKGELYDYLRKKKDSFIFLNADDADLNRIAQGLKALRYAVSGLSGVSGDSRESGITGIPESSGPFLAFRWWSRNCGPYEVQTHLVGQYNMDNVLCAVAVGMHFGVAPVDINEAISSYEPTNSRSQLMKTAHNTLIVDAYNANPTSMEAALKNFAQMNAERKMVILGEMRELGEASRNEHLRILELLTTLNFSQTWTVGQEFVNPSFTFRNFKDAEEVIDTLKAEKPNGMTILIKGSNSVRLSSLVPFL